MNTAALQSIVAIAASIAAIIWGFHAAITRPLVKHIEFLREDTKLLRAELSEGVKTLRAEIVGLRGETYALREQLTQRLDRIETKLDNHGERITRLEEQRFR